MSLDRAKQSHNAHDFECVTVYYRWHPLFGQTVRVHRRHRIRSADYLHIKLPDGTMCGLPAWMFDSACLEFLIGEPLISVEALNALRNLLDASATNAGKCDNPVLNTLRTGDTHESSGEPAPAAKSETGRSIADRGRRREKRGTDYGDHRSAPGGNRDGRRGGAGAT